MVCCLLDLITKSYQSWDEVRGSKTSWHLSIYQPKPLTPYLSAINILYDFAYKPDDNSSESLDHLVIFNSKPPVSMTTTAVKALSQNDLDILGALFDPETSLSANSETPITSQTAALPIAIENTIPKHIILAEKAILRPLNTQNPSPNDLKIAISKLSHLIIEQSTYASAYTNRAQATRLLPNSLTDPNLLYSILSDLHHAISLATSTASNPTHTRILSTSHIHRAYILLSASQNPKIFNTLLSLDLQSLGLPLNLSTSKLEELASHDFSIAGRYGDEQARKMAVKTNPYAKLCGSIVREALREEIRGFYEGR